MEQRNKNQSKGYRGDKTDLTAEFYQAREIGIIEKIFYRQYEKDITIKGGLRSRLDKKRILKDGLITGETESTEEKLPSIEKLNSI